MLLFHLRITPQRQQRFACHALIGACVAWAVAALVAMLTRCGTGPPYSLFGQRCEDYVCAATLWVLDLVADGRTPADSYVDRHLRYGLLLGACDLRGAHMDRVEPSDQTRIQSCYPAVLCISSTVLQLPDSPPQCPPDLRILVPLRSPPYTQRPPPLGGCQVSLRWAL